MELYQQRLSNLPKMLEELYSTIIEDEGLKLIKDEQLTKYKIERIGEIIDDIMNSEK